jgi:hypothetical protein
MGISTLHMVTTNLQYGPSNPKHNFFLNVLDLFYFRFSSLREPRRDTLEISNFTNKFL